MIDMYIVRKELGHQEMEKNILACKTLFLKVCSVKLYNKEESQDLLMTSRIAGHVDKDKVATKARLILLGNDPSAG